MTRQHHPFALPPAFAARGLALAAVLSAAGALAACTARPEPEAGPAPPPLAAAPPQAAAQLQVLRQPMEITSRGGVLNVTMAAVFRNLPVPGKGTMKLRTYQVLRANGIDYTDSAKFGFPGPTLRVFPGDSVHIVLLNRMWDTTTAGANPPADTSNTACASYPAAGVVDHFEDCFHGSNWTNIHYHGMHVTPASNGDDVLLLIPPGSTYTYGFRIPWNQSAGTHWYHPHKHGSVAIQVLNGMSGALIVDGGPLDTLARAHRMRERLIALQQIDTLPNLMTANVFGQTFLVNGQQTPVIVMAPGEVQRWRIVNENVTKTNNFQISIADSAGQEPQLFDVARDGVAYANVNYAPNGVPIPNASVIMSPGNRLDLFVQAPGNAGVFSVHAQPVGHDVPQDQTRKAPLRQGRLRAGVQAPAAAAAQNPPLFYVQVDSTLPPNGSTLPGRLPQLPYFLRNLPGPLSPDSILANPSRLAVVVFADSGFGNQTHQQPPRFYLGTVPSPRMQFNSSFTYVPLNARGDSLPMVLDSVQTWMVQNRSPATNHPFHIHINPFQVIAVFQPNPRDPNAPLYTELNLAAQRGRAPIWLDVVPLPLPRLDTLSTSPLRVDTTAGYVLIRQAYLPFLNADRTVCANCGDPTGWFVMHCHILGHEERGMMQVLQIVRPGQRPRPPPAPEAHRAATGAVHRH